MPDLIPLLTRTIKNHTEDGVSAKVLYDFLGLTPASFARWTKKNIVNNPYAIEHDDWEKLQHDAEDRIHGSSRGPLTQDYALSLDFAKRLSMMARSAKGEEARRYFLDCERRATTPQMPQLHDPIAQALLHVVIDHDATKHRLAIMEEAQRRTEVKADQAIAQQNFWTVAEYVQYHDLKRQCPTSAYVDASRHMQAYCRRSHLNFRDPAYLPRRIPVGDKGWETEWGFHTSVFEAAFLPWLLRRSSQTHLRLVEGEEA